MHLHTQTQVSQLQYLSIDRLINLQMDVTQYMECVVTYGKQKKKIYKFNKGNYKFKKYYDRSKRKKNYESKMRTRDPRIINYRLDNGQLSEQMH